MDQDLKFNFYEKLRGLAEAMHDYHWLSYRQQEPWQDPNHGQGRILALLKIQPEMKSKDLAYVLGIRQQSLNQSLQKLEAAGYIQRRPSSDDRRTIVVSLTDKGRTAKQESGQPADVLDKFSKQELEQFGSYVDRLHAAFDQQLGHLRRPESEARQAYLESMRQRMGTDNFDEMMRQCRHMGMPMGMHGWHHRHHHQHDFDCDC